MGESPGATNVVEREQGEQDGISWQCGKSLVDLNGIVGPGSAGNGEMGQDGPVLLRGALAVRPVRAL